MICPDADQNSQVLFCFERGTGCVGLAVLELSLYQSGLELRDPFACLPGGIKGMCPHHLAK